MRVLLTNDDGIAAEGLQTLRRALMDLADVELVVIAPAVNQSATARSITTRRPLTVEEVDFGDRTVGYSCDGTPVDCVRLGHLGLVDGFRADVIVSGINHGANLGDDITYSGTVAAALEGVLLGLPAIAVSQQAIGSGLGFEPGTFDFDCAARFTARVVDELDDVPLAPGTLLNVNVPAADPVGVEVARLGKRIYRDQLKLSGTAEDGRRRYSVYGRDPGYHDEPGTDLAAVAAGRIAVTPIHFDLTHVEGIDALVRHDMERLLAPARRAVRE